MHVITYLNFFGRATDEIPKACIIGTNKKNKNKKSYPPGDAFVLQQQISIIALLIKKNTGCTSQCDLAIFKFKSILRQKKKELWKLKYFSPMQKLYNLQKNPRKRKKPKSFKIYYYNSVN